MNRETSDVGPAVRFEAVVAEPGAMQEVVRLLTEGTTLRGVAKLWRIPYGRLAAWICEDVERTASYEQALRIWVDGLAQETVAIADAATPETTGVAKVQIDARIRLAERLNRDRYGPSLKVERPVVVEPNAGLLQEARELLRLVVRRELPAPRVIEAESTLI